MGASNSTPSPNATTVTTPDDSVSKLHDANSFINTVVNKNCVVIFSKTDCPYSNKAKKIFDNLGVCYESIELNQREDCRVLQAALLQISGEKTVPRVFINGSCIGGGVDTEKLYQEGKLAFLLDQCSVMGTNDNVNPATNTTCCLEQTNYIAMSQPNTIGNAAMGQPNTIGNAAMGQPNTISGNATSISPPSNVSRTIPMTIIQPNISQNTPMDSMEGCHTQTDS